MSIKLTNVVYPSVEDLRKVFRDSQEELTKNLRMILNNFAEKGRPELEASYAKSYINAVEWFIKARKENPERGGINVTIAQFNHPAQREDEDYYTYQDRIKRCSQVESELVYLLTDYPKAPKENDSDDTWYSYNKWLSDTKRPDFEINLLPDYQKLALEKANKTVQNIVDIFIDKTVDKLLDILIAKKEYTVRLMDSIYDSGVFTCDLALTFPDQTGFNTHLILKWNVSVLGKNFTQYPMTFHQAVLKTGDKATARVSQEDIEKAFGVKMWTPPPQPTKKWKSVKTGFIIFTNYPSDHGQFALIERVTKDKKRIVKKAKTKYHKDEYGQNVQCYVGPNKIMECQDVAIVRPVAELYVNSSSYSADPYAFATLADGSRHKYVIDKMDLETFKRLDYRKQDTFLRRMVFDKLKAEGKLI